MEKKIASSRDFLGKTVMVKIDRPLNTEHSEFGCKYAFNYGFVSGTLSPDEEKLDV